jgi:hypothetical protein
LSHTSLLRFLRVRRAPFVSVCRTRRRRSRIPEFRSGKPNFTVSYFPAPFSSCSASAVCSVCRTQRKQSGEVQDGKVGFTGPKFWTPATFSSCLASPVHQCLPTTKKTEPDSKISDWQNQLQLLEVPCSSKFLRVKVLSCFCPM